MVIYDDLLSSTSHLSEIVIHDVNKFAPRLKWQQAIKKTICRNKCRRKWIVATQTILSMKKLFVYYETLKDKDERPEYRFYAAVQLKIYFKDETDVAPKLLHLKRLLSDASLSEKLWDEFSITGQNLYDWCSPSKMGEHVLWFTSLFAILLIAVYSYMCADYRNYKQQSYGPHIGSALGTSFDFTFLNSWKGFNALAVKNGEDSRWFVSIIEHQGLQHIVSNLLLFCLVSGDLEHKYGTKRIIITSFGAGVGGNLFSAVAENGCGIIVGASGLIFGLVAFWVADLIVNFHFLKRTFVKTAIASLFFLFFIITVFSQSHVSNWSHLGGFLSGLFLAMLFLPRLGKQRIEATLLYIGLAGTFLYFLILPLVAYKVVFPKIVCNSV